MKNIKNSGYRFVCFFVLKEKKHIYIRHESQNSWLLDRSLEALLTVLMG